MKFFQITATLISKIDIAEAENERQISRKYRSCFEHFYHKNEEKLYFFVSKIFSNTLYGGIIALEPFLFENNIIIPWADLNLEVDNVTLKEIDSEDIGSCLKEASINDYIENPRMILDRFDLNKIFSTEGGLMNGTDSYNEKLFDATQCREDIQVSAANILWDQSLNPEVDRIYTEPEIKNVKGHPVHYVFCGNNYDVSEKACELLMSALYQNNRLVLRRYCSIDVLSLCNRELIYLEKIFEIYSGGAIIFKFAFEQDDDCVAGSCIHESIKEISKQIKIHCNDVLTIFCFPLLCNREKELFFEQLDDISFIVFEEGIVDKNKAQNYLFCKAKSDKYPTTDGLINKISEERNYYPDELNNIYREWAVTYMRNIVYPQYKSVQLYQRQIVDEKVNGSACVELHNMIGLDEVKKLIDSALDFYKAQKLFSERGRFTNNPAMHMVFTGNPGTAKTTVARLFSKIMRDNLLLSSGHIVEVGRGDLVGKYVGWTADKVQKKFRQAKGGVLFIDEAYSLVDDKDGLYGDEAINTIVQEMENRRDDIIVIFAGYPDKMKSFINRNPGLRSRIAYHVHFDDYSADQLYKITELMANDNKLRLADSVKDKLMPIYENAIKAPDFGNGRFVRNLIEKAIMSQASRLVRRDFNKITDEDLSTLISEDFNINVPVTTNSENRRIGFFN